MPETPNLTPEEIRAEITRLEIEFDLNENKIKALTSASSAILDTISRYERMLQLKEQLES